MSLDCPPTHRPVSALPQEVAPADPRVAILPWLRGLLVAAALVGTTPAAWSGDIRVGFLNPNGPPEFWLLVSATMRAAAAELGINVDERHFDRSFDKAIALARDFLRERPPPDYLIATNDVGVGGEIIKLADAAGIRVILLNNDLDTKQGAEYGEPRTKYRHWLGSIVPDHEGGGYGIAEAILIEAGRCDPIALLYVATVLARRVDSANRALVELKRQVQAGQPSSVIDKTVEKIEELLGASGANLVYAGYPYDPFALNATKN